MKRCDCTTGLIPCFNCKHMICVDHARTVVKLKVLFSGTISSLAGDRSMDTYYFCSCACLFAWNLQLAHDNLAMHGAVDYAWIPVIKQLYDSVQFSIKESIQIQDSKGAHLIMTFESTDIIKVMLTNDGIYPGDPQMYSIYKYQNKITERWLYAVFMQESHFDLDVSPYVGEFKLLWQNGKGLTEEGKKLLEEGS